MILQLKVHKDFSIGEHYKSDRIFVHLIFKDWHCWRLSALIGEILRIEVGTTVLPKNAKFLVIFAKTKISVVRKVEVTGFLDETVLHVLQVEVCQSASIQFRDLEQCEMN